MAIGKPKRRRKRLLGRKGLLVRSGPLLGVLSILLVAAVGYVLLAAAWQAAASSYRFADLLVPRAIDVLVAAWLFWVGSAIGSFLNVVAWRVPRGKSINGWSHCPWCNARLSARDNWPVFGWIALRGRCRTCRLPISPRYPIVELCVGLTITVLGLAEFYSGGGNLPFVSEGGPHHPRQADGPLATPHLSLGLVVISLYHVVAISSAWALGLVRFDAHRLPRGLVIWVFLLAMGPLWIWPPLMVVPWQATVPEGWQPTSHYDAVLRLLTAIVAAALLARALARYLCPTADPKLDPTGSGTARLLDLTALLCVPAVVVGWQALLGVVLLSVIGAAILQRLARRFSEPGTVGSEREGLAWLAVCLPVGLAVQIAFWERLEAWLFWPSASSPPWVILVAAALLLVVPRCLTSRRALDSL
ncbi:prepilin peptidase [Candidatus Laterigemmans baculatus]|uniref:prepilin peptidase n=1 Tax=Candidatus Laterigemmans baculatus TaxID=2770505 RepID=UPI00193C0510|nr:A24 family peptidase [Candidatus Laterigemmans baculatus]